MMTVRKLKLSLLICFCIALPAMAQQNQTPQNIQSKGIVTKDNTIKLRWSPANPKAWVDGRKYGYVVEKYTMSINGVWQQMPQKQKIDKSFKPAPLNDWKQKVENSDYAAVVAQSFYGESFELSSSSKGVGDIINQATELEQRYSTSVFMAEYDYQTAELAGWAWTDLSAKPNERYLYRIYLNRPDKLQGDTTAIYIGIEDKKELPKPIGFNAVWGDKSVLLSWNYALLSNIYHSYHIERKSSQESKYKRITNLPVTPLNADMNELFYADSLENNELDYSFRIVGMTSFDEESPVSDTISGHGIKKVSCVPYISSAYFTEKDQAHTNWEFECNDIDWVRKFQLKKSTLPDEGYDILIDSISLDKREIDLNLYNETNYIKLCAINKDGTQSESFPFLLRQVDSIPPAVPKGLTVEIDTLGIAHLNWEANTEPDLRGYRILRAFTQESEKSSITPQLIKDNYYTDTLSLRLGNAKVYYALTAVDIRYNESAPCEDVAALKPNNSTPSEPVFTGYEISDDKVTLSWITDPKAESITYELVRIGVTSPKNDQFVTLGNYEVTSYTDIVPESGTYKYIVVAVSPDGKKSSSQLLEFDVTVSNAQNEVSGFVSYVDRKNNYIELSWRKHEKAQTYRLYKAEENGKTSLWKELDASKNRLVDEQVSPGTNYSYTILFLNSDGRASKSKTIIVEY
jgi:hypothetical protein